MDQEKFAERLSSADTIERLELLTHHPPPDPVALAWSLKALYDQVESTDISRAANVAAAITSLAEITGEKEITAIAAWTEGMVVLDAGQLEAAIANLDDAELHFLDSGQTLHAAATQISKLRALAVLGRYEEALHCGLQTRDVFLAHHDMLAAGKIEQNLGNLHFLLDRYISAEEFYRSARDRFEVAGDQKQLAQIDNCLATTLTSQHRFHEANLIYEQARSRAEAAGLEITLAEIETNQGCLALFQGHYDRALDYLEKSRRRYAALGMTPWSAIADQELADAYLELNLAPESAAIYERVIPIFSELGMHAEQARALAYLGRARLALGQVSAALLLLEESLALYRSANNPVGEAMVTLFEAQAHYAEGDFAAAETAAARAESPFAEVHAWGRLLAARWLKGEANRAQGKFREAEVLLKDALHDAENWTVLPVIQRCHTSLGLLAEALGDETGAELAFKHAIASIEETRMPLPAEEFRVAYLADKLVPYTELVRLCLADGRPSRVAEALDYVERARSRSLVEMQGGVLQTTPKLNDAFEAELFERLERLREELNWFYSQINRPDSDAASRGAAMMATLYDAVRMRETEISEITLQLRQRNASVPIQVEPFNLAGLQTEIGPETALLEYFSLDGELLVFIVTDQGVDVIRLPSTEVEIESSLRQFHFQIGALRHGAEYLHDHLPSLVDRARHHLCKLYDGLIRPIEKRIDGRRLLVVPYRALHYIPFHALHDGKRYIIENHEVCYSPSAAVIRHSLAARRGSFQRAALFGISDERTPRVREEILALAPLFPDAVAFLDNQATIASLYENSSNVDVLHLACHGRFRPDNPLFSSLQLADGWFNVRDAYRLNLATDLVTLSACETGVSALAPGDELMGLARGFFSAGAPSLIVSLWTVEDEATATLMTDFYSRLQTGAGLAASLRHAQCRLLEDHPHPYFWAPFVLMGRW